MDQQTIFIVQERQTVHRFVKSLNNKIPMITDIMLFIYKLNAQSWIELRFLSRRIIYQSKHKMFRDIMNVLNSKQTSIQFFFLCFH